MKSQGYGDGYSWYKDHEANKHYVKVRVDGCRSQVEDIDVLWVVPSSTSSGDLKELAVTRLDQRWENTCKSFDDYLKIRSSCYIIEQKGNEFYCDCFIGSKGNLCKHAVGLMYKLGKLEVTSDVRSKPLGVKRKRGRPAKLRHCLAKTPPRVPERSQEVIPTAEYHEMLPQLQTISLPQVITAPLLTTDIFHCLKHSLNFC